MLCRICAKRPNFIPTRLTRTASLPTPIRSWDKRRMPAVSLRRLSASRHKEDPDSGRQHRTPVAFRNSADSSSGKSPNYFYRLRCCDGNLWVPSLIASSLR